MGIALGIARGIYKSHSPKIANFGLAKLLMPDQTRTFTGIKGRGFVTPEWHKNLPVTAKVDVFSFGIVFLVITCYRRSVDVNLSDREAILADWVYKCFKANKVKKLIPNEADEQDFERMVRIALWSIQEELTVRPARKKVVAMFEGIVEVPTPPSLTSSTNASLRLIEWFCLSQRRNRSQPTVLINEDNALDNNIGNISTIEDLITSDFREFARRDSTLKKVKRRMPLSQFAI